MGDTFRDALRNREVLLGTWIQIGHPAVAEVLSSVDYDWIAADCEHTDIEIEGFTGVLRGMYGRGPVPLARVEENSTMAIRRVLDMGAQGVIVPLIADRRGAQEAVSAAKFPPEGKRGFSFCRANSWGADFDSYVRTANQDVAVIAMVETRQAVENIEEILSVEGVDGVFVGPYDLSGSFGRPGDTEHPEIREALKRVVSACERYGRAAGLHVVDPDPEAIEEAVGAGFTFLALGVDTVFLKQAAQTAHLRARIAVDGGEKNRE